MNVKKEKETVVFIDKPDITKELDDISEAQEDIKKLKAIVLQKEDAIKLKQEQELREKREMNFQIACEEHEKLIDTIKYFQNTAPFNNNFTFLKRLTDFYNHLDRYVKSPFYKTKKVEEMNDARALMRRVRNAGNGALATLGDQAYRELLKSFTDRFLAIENFQSDMAKTLKKIEKRLPK